MFLTAGPAISKVFSFSPRGLHPYCSACAGPGNGPSPDIPPMGCVHLRAFNPGCAVASLSHACPEINGKATETAKAVGVNATNQLRKQPCSAEVIFPGFQAL